jgi:hypothetical protein
MSDKLYFGQGCVYFTGWWEPEERERENYKNKFEPTLTHCIHKNNPEEREGNCAEIFCPLLKKDK